MITGKEIGILVNFFVDTLQTLISISSAKFNKCDAGNVILFQIKLFARNIKETMLARYFIKVTARPSFTQLRVIRRIENMLQRFSVVSPSYLNLLVQDNTDCTNSI